MKKTRKELVELLTKDIESLSEKYPDIVNIFVNVLEKSGLVEIEEEPREFWINIQGRFIHAFFTEDQVIGAMGEVIHVHSVDQCRKYEKMWNQIKDDFRQFSSVTNRMEELERGTY